MVYAILFEMLEKDKQTVQDLSTKVTEQSRSGGGSDDRMGEMNGKLHVAVGEAKKLLELLQKEFKKTLKVLLVDFPPEFF